MMANPRKDKTPSVVAATQGAIVKTFEAFTPDSSATIPQSQVGKFALLWLTRRCAITQNLAPTIAFLASIKGESAND